MATRCWSNDSIVAEHKDLQASAMAVDQSGTLALLYGRRYLAVVNLDEPTETLKKVLRQSKYEVGTADWNPASSHGQFAFSSNQKVEVLRWTNSDFTTEHSLKAHTRVVADLQWHRTDPNLLATCSLDTFLHIWDLRDLRRPALSLSAIVGASHVRWNWTSKDILASAHDGDVKIWDQRKGTAPFQYVSAHLAKIHSLDWNPNSENHLVTSSQDCTVKFFDVNSPRRAESVLTFSFPVWRARHAPFGNGLVTVVVSPLRREENSLLLWNIENQAAPVHTFVGHTDVVQEVAWRKQKDDNHDFQLVTWCKDQSLRIWRIEPSLQKLCGHSPAEPNEEAKEIILDNEILTDPVESQEAVVEDPSPEPTEITTPIMSSPSQAPKTLQQEFSLTNFNIPNVRVDEMDAVARTCIVTATINTHVAVLLFSFPPGYPFNSSPTFQLIKGSTIDASVQAKILKAVKQTAQQRVRKNKSCLEPCLRTLVSSLESLVLTEDTSGNNDFMSQYLEPTSVYGSFKDAYIPFPRSSGVAFCSAGLLVCFGQPGNLSRRVSVRSESSATPRSLSALGPASAAFVSVGSIPPLFAQAGGGNGSQVPEAQGITSFYFPDRQRARSKGRNSASGPSTHRGSVAKPSNKISVTIYDSAGLLFVHRELAEKYKLKGRDTAEVCHHNAGVALSAGRKDLAQVWQLAALAAATPPLPLPLASHWSENDEDSPSAWAAHPFGRAMIEALIQHYAIQCDVQTAAMLSCMFGSRTENLPGHRKKIPNANVSPGGSPYHTVHPADTSLEGWNFHMLKQNRSNSWSDSLDEIKLLTSTSETTDPARMEEIELSHSKMLDEKNSELHDCFKRVYAEILYRWELLEARAQVLKYVSTNIEVHKGVEFLTDCLHCSKPAQGPSCIFCKRLALQCAICHVSVRGSANFCLVCGHGGHTQHMTSWFAKENQCPTGCGCKCLKDSGSILEP
ncbi:GATOR complex protein WDR59 isoform X2 [Neocloeon triangulifer]|uniref:GATOR complex protein WDR59 isoform X2 n=1 Tax=Neocloeon triangulifer TaxID=2078957 RepID=UPI00286ED27D|nr:GATOR complex protein WDR59 isoform X2 [Neocloeon triangulifer]